MNDAACSTTSSVAGTEPRKPVKGRSSFSPMPSDWAARSRSSWLTFSCWLMKAVLHEKARAVCIGMSPSLSFG